MELVENLYSNYLPYPFFTYFAASFTMGKNENIHFFFKPVTRLKCFVHTTNGFALNHAKSLQIFFFCVKCQAKNDFSKDVERRTVLIFVFHVK